MTEREQREEDVAFARFRATGAPESLARVFDLTAGKLVLLAMHLARDESAAEDLVQETFLAAIDAASRYDPSRPVLPWLVGILTHVGRMAHRRARPEQWIATDVAAAQRDPREVAEAEELAEDIARALDSLPEHYRAVLLLRFVHGLRSVQIARTLSRSPETVRTQVRRGLELLRNALPKSLALPAVMFIGSGRGLAAVRAVVLGKASVAHAPLALAAGIGGLVLMKKVATVSAVVLLLGAAAYFGLQPAEPIRAVTPESVASVESPARNEQKPDAKPESGLVRTAERTPVPAAPASVSEAKLAEVRGRCVADESGAPLLGCKVALRGRPLDAARSQRWHETGWKGPQPVLTGPDGAFALPFAAASPSMITVTVESEGRVFAEGYWTDWPAGEVRDLGEIRLQLGTRASGRVVDEAGLSQEGVEVTVEAPPPVLNKQFACWPFTARSQRDGSITFGNNPFEPDGPVKLLPPGTWPVRVGSGHVLVKPRTVVVIGGQALAELTIVVKQPDPNATLSGVVIDPTGFPVASARVEAHLYKPEGGTATGLGSARTLADGTFRIQCAGEALEPIQLTCWSPDRGQPLVDPRTFRWGASGIRLEGRRDVRGGVQIEVVEAGSGKPVEEYGVLCLRDPGRGSAGGGRDQVQHGGHHAEGKLRISLRGAGRYLLIVHPERPGFVPSAPVFFAFDGESVAPLRVEVGPPKTLVAKVVRTDGSAVAGTKVQLLHAFGDDEIGFRTKLIRADDLGRFSTTATLAFLLDEGATNATGIARLSTPPAARSLVLRVLGPGHVALLGEKVAMPKGDGPVTIVVETGGTLQGTLRPQGLLAKLALLDNPDTRVGSSSLLTNHKDHERGLVMHRVGTTGERLTGCYAVDDDGSFRITGIPAGSWEVLLTFPIAVGTVRMSGAGDTRLATVVFAGEETRHLDLDGTRFLPGQIRGRILLDGMPAKSVTWSLIGRRDGHHGYRLGGSALDAEGRFSAVTVPAGEYRLGLYFKDPASDKERPLFATGRVQVAPGDEVERVFELARRTLRIRVVESDGTTPRKEIMLHVKDEGSWLTRAERTDDKGEVVLDPAPLEPVVVEVRVPEAEDQEFWSLPEDERRRRTVHVGTVEALPDQRETKVELRLPPGVR